MSNKYAGHTPGPWKWLGEDYRGGWGWQLLVDSVGRGVLCGEGKDGPYKHLRAHIPIDEMYCKTGAFSDEDSAPGVHVREPDAALIADAPTILADRDALAADRDALAAENARLREALRECADRFECCCTANGNDPYISAIAVADYRAILAAPKEGAA